MKWKKVVSILCVAAMTLGMLAGCGSGGGDEEGAEATGTDEEVSVLSLIHI